MITHIKRGRSKSASDESRAVARRSDSLAEASQADISKPGSGVASQLVGFGKHKWLTFQQLAEQQHYYCQWILEHKAPSDQMRRLQDYLRQHPFHSASATSELTDASADATMPSWIQRILRNGEALDARQYTATITDRAIKPDRVKLLHRYQHEAIAFGVKRNGRVLLADEMGLGKTIQALAIVAHYLDDWPVLIVVPAALRFVWRQEIRTWLSCARTQVVAGNSSHFNPSCNVFITSYDLITRCKHLQKPPTGGEFQVVICDESHYLKNAMSLRSQVLVPLLQGARRAILLSGTPMLNGAFDLHPQLDALMPEAIPAPMAFAQRYCNIEDDHLGHTVFTGTLRSQELNRVLAVVMVRRQKAEVLKELPPKRWRVVPVESLSDPGTELAWTGDPEMAHRRGHAFFSKAWEQVGKAKIAFAVEYSALLLDGMPATQKLLLFAHHHAVADGLREKLQALHPGGDSVVLIDGRTPEARRHQNVCRFQEDPRVRVAILSICACAHGLTMTAASCIVFAELFPVPGIMMQAEDRAHRIGQMRCVDIHYLVAHHTVDDTIINALERKREDVGEVLLVPVAQECQMEASTAPAVKLSSNKEIVAHLVAMGFDSAKASDAAVESGGCIEKALDILQTPRAAGSTAHSEALDFLPTPRAAGSTAQSEAAQLVMMGFDADAAAAALRSMDGQFDDALELLLSAKGGA